MRTITTELFKFVELSKEAREKAIENYREGLYEGKYGSDSFPGWAIDDCSLFEPKHENMVNLFGEYYYIENKEEFVFKNNREGIAFSFDYARHLSFHQALEITNNKMFLEFLGIPHKFHRFIEYGFYHDSDRYPDSKIEFEMENSEDLNSQDFAELEKYIEVATTRFDDHRKSILDKIERDIEYRYSDESIREELENGASIEFTADGEIWEE